MFSPSRLKIGIIVVRMERNGHSHKVCWGQTFPPLFGNSFGYLLDLSHLYALTQQSSRLSRDIYLRFFTVALLSYEKLESPCTPINKGTGRVCGSASHADQNIAVGKSNQTQTCWAGMFLEGSHEQGYTESVVYSTLLQLKEYKMHVHKCISLEEGRTYPFNCGGEGELFLKPLWCLEEVHCFCSWKNSGIKNRLGKIVQAKYVILYIAAFSQSEYNQPKSIFLSTVYNFQQTQLQNIENSKQNKTNRDDINCNEKWSSVLFYSLFGSYIQNSGGLPPKYLGQQ